MEKNDTRTAQTVKFLKWTRQYGGWWYLICTPNDESMNPQIMKLLIEKLADNSFYEIIFVLIMVHRNEPFVDDFVKAMFTEAVIQQWDESKDEIIQKFIEYLE